jgi:hypothetical protein
MTPPCSPVFPAAVIARLDSTETRPPFDADEEDRRNDEDDEQEELERQERQDEEDGEDIYSDDLRGNFVRSALRKSSARTKQVTRNPVSGRAPRQRRYTGGCAGPKEPRCGTFSRLPAGNRTVSAGSFRPASASRDSALGATLRAGI